MFRLAHATGPLKARGRRPTGGRSVGRRHGLRPPAFVALLLLGACPSGEQTMPGEAWVELGTGEWRFEPLADEQEVELVRGAQGGWHVWVSFRAGGFEPEGVQMELVSRVLEPALPERSSSVPVRLERISPEGTLGLLGWPAIQADPECVVDHRLLLRITLTDRAGESDSDERVVIPRSEPATRPSEPCEAEP